jgi:hypothetical protein
MQIPSVTTTITDNSYYTPYFTNEVACYCGSFQKGPINEPVLITSISEFEQIFGFPEIGFDRDWFQVHNYLQYSSGIYIVRSSPIGSNAYATIDEPGLFVQVGLVPGFGVTPAHVNAFDSNSLTGEVRINNEQTLKELYSEYDGLSVFAKTPGAWGNDIEVAIIQKSNFDNNVTIKNNNTAKSIFNYFTEGYFGVVVFYKGELKETFYTNNVNTIFSDYIYLISNFEEDTLIVGGTSLYGENILSLSLGNDAFVGESDLIEAYSLFENKDEYDIDIIIGNELYNQAAIELAEKRRDCIAFIGMPTQIYEFLSDHEGNAILTEDNKGVSVVRTRFSYNLTPYDEQIILNYIDTVQQSQFVHFTVNIKEQFDVYSGKNRYVNIAADTAGLKAQASKNTPWSVGAGLERGLIKNAKEIHLKFKEPGMVFDKGVNFIQGGALMSQRTFITTPTSFDRVNIRSVFNHVEKECARMLRHYVFELNDRQMRGRIASNIKQYLENVKAARGIDAGKVIVTGDHNTVKIDVYIKPTYVAEFIQLRMTNTGQDTISQYLTGQL